MIKKLNNYLHTPNWLFVLLVVVLALRIPSFFEPYSYGDEMIYLSLGEAVRQGETLYKTIHDNKPPLLYLAAALAGNLLWFKAILAMWHGATVYIFWKFADFLFGKNSKLVKIATIIFALLTTLPLLEGNIVNSELFMVGPTMLAFYILLSQKDTTKNLLAAGMLFSVATLFKMPAIFDIPAIVVFWLFTTKLTFKNVKKIAVKSLIIASGVALPVGATIAWYGLRDAFQEYVVAAFLQNVGYLSSFRPDDVVEPFLVRNGPLLIRGLVVLVGIVILYFQRKKLSKNFLFITAWLLLTLFAVTLSERPYPHYLIQSTAPLALLLGMFFAKRNVEQALVVIPLALFFFVPVYYKFWLYPTSSYYARFAKLTTGQISLDEYRATFGGNIVRNYAIADYLQSVSARDDKVFIWGDGSQLYALSRRLPPIRYVADYHIKDFSSKEEVLATLSQNPPLYIIVLPNSVEFNELNMLLNKSYLEVENIDSAGIWRYIDQTTREEMLDLN